MLKSEAQAQLIVNKLNYTDPTLKENTYKSLLHFFKFHFGEYRRIPRKRKKELKKQKSLYSIIVKTD